jgi:hypothetical protein
VTLEQLQSLLQEWIDDLGKDTPVFLMYEDAMQSGLSLASDDFIAMDNWL